MTDSLLRRNPRGHTAAHTGDVPTMDTPPKPRYRTHVILFVLTLFTTACAGYMTPLQYNIIDLPDSLDRIEDLVQGLPFALCVMGILTAHEMGHYVLSRHHGMRASLPYFLPSPLAFGTLGAVIVTRSPYPNRNALMDIGAAGPIAGFLVAVPVTIVGIGMSSVHDLSTLGTGYITLGDPLIIKILTYFVIGPLPEGQELFIHPVAFAGWFGFLITMMNLMPVNQLDGGHILYAFMGATHVARRVQIGVAVASFVCMAVLGIYFIGWYVWLAMLIGLSVKFKFRHPQSLDDFAPLDRRRKLIGICTILIMIASFIPVPFQF